MKNRLPILLIIFLFTSLIASAQSWLWGVQGSGGLKADLFVKNVATNKTGNVYQTGAFETSITFGSDTLISGNVDIFLVKYDSNGNLLWAKTSKGSGSDDFGYSVATDDSDNSYITGYLEDTTVFGTDTLYGGSVFLVKYNPGGNVVWATTPNVAGKGWAVVTDNFGHEYITGTGAFLVKYDRNGNFVWNRFPVTGNSATGYSISADNFGNAYVSGQFSDSLVFGNYKLYSANAAAFIVKFDSNGNMLWAQQSTHNPFNNIQRFNDIAGYSVVTDRSGAVYLTGTFSDSITFGSHAFTTPNLITFNFFLVKFNPTGTIIWAKDATVDSTSGGWGTYSICTDDSNHIYISGAEGSPSTDSFIFEKDTISIKNPTGDNPAFLLKLDTSGRVICSSILPSGGTNTNAIASDSTGEFVYLGGEFYSSFVLGNDNLMCDIGAADPYIGRWQSCIGCDLAVAASPQAPSICNGQSINLTANGAANYTWSPTAGLSATTGSSLIANPILTTTYHVSASSNGCSDNTQIVVTVNPLPIIGVSPSQSLCTGDSAILTATGGNSYIWSPASGLSATTGDNVLASPMITTTYRVTGTDSLGCIASDSTVLTVIPSPNKPTFTQYGDTLISSSKYDNQWYRNDSLLTNDTSQYFIISVSGEYWVIVNNEANGCSTASDSMNIITITTAINQLSANNNQLSIYPNPTTGEINIVSTKPIDEIKITDLLGQLIYESQPKQMQFTFQLKDEGMYFVTGTSDTETLTKKVLVIKN